MTVGFLLIAQQCGKGSVRSLSSRERYRICNLSTGHQHRPWRLATALTPRVSGLEPYRRCRRERQLCPLISVKAQGAREQPHETPSPNQENRDAAKADLTLNPRYYTRPRRVSKRQRMLERDQNNAVRQQGRRRLQAVFCGQVIAEASDYIFTDGRYYFPPGSVRDEFLIETDETRMMNPIGRARMMDVRVGPTRIRRAAWRFYETRRSDGGVWTALQSYTTFWKSVRLRFAPRANGGD
ncbi:hypothetical protein F1559_000511 [Cyanidiococcus yangmingshanensis]|uniref:DUF427 domain-containing protein n=1 Tax=Cyanidiococcus yangmingshanensis TaxID=2690220 RepID=A0A7J7IJD7_9RHOD|nr:hypothetical protein F1559_000511 [Cyanidiococcus yangmingshanensis]